MMAPTNGTQRWWQPGQDGDSWPLAIHESAHAVAGALYDRLPVHGVAVTLQPGHDYKAICYTRPVPGATLDDLAHDAVIDLAGVVAVRALTDCPHGQAWHGAESDLRNVRAKLALLHPSTPDVASDTLNAWTATATGLVVKYRTEIEAVAARLLDRGELDAGEVWQAIHDDRAARGCPALDLSAACVVAWSNEL